MSAKLLVLPASPWNCLPTLFQTAMHNMKDTSRHGKVYVHVIPNRWPAIFEQAEQVDLGKKIQLTKNLYGRSASFPHLDIRFLLHGIKPGLAILPSNVERPAIAGVSEVIFASLIEKCVQESYLEHFQTLYQVKMTSREVPTSCQNSPAALGAADSNDSFDEVVLGGTFDRLHAGHKVLLCEALLRARKRVVIGVTQAEMLRSKTLAELILPFGERIQQLRDFLVDSDPSLEYSLVALTDPFGPSVQEPQLEAIIGSKETQRGCEKVNQLRAEKGLSQLKMFLVGLEEDPAKEVSGEENKVSSSSFRRRLLGTLLKAPLKPWHESDGPYIIGLCGGSAGGKSSVAKRFQALGAHVIDCDALGHKAYEPASECYRKVVSEFGEAILKGKTFGQEIDRAELGRLVFGSPENKSRLEAIVWPEILKMVEMQLAAIPRNEVVILDAAVLLMAKWHEQVCHQVWCCVIDPDEAVARIVERDGKTKEEAEKRLRAQWTNKQIVSEANVVFCTKWEPEVTQMQVEKAWDGLQALLQGEQA